MALSSLFESPIHSVAQGDKNPDDKLTPKPAAPKKTHRVMKTGEA